MKLFISHAIKDKEFLKMLQRDLEFYNIELFIAKHYEDLERDITDKIKYMIDQSDAALIILTKNGFNSSFVQQEIGYLVKSKKPYLQLIEPEIRNKITGFNYGKGGIDLDIENPDLTIAKVRKSLLNYWTKKKQKDKEQTMKVLGVLAITIAVLAAIERS